MCTQYIIFRKLKLGLCDFLSDFPGKSAALKDSTNPDWIPSIDMPTQAEGNVPIEDPVMYFDAQEINEIHLSIAKNVETMTELTMEGLRNLIIERERKVKLLEDMKDTNFFTSKTTFKTMNRLFELLEPFLPESKGKLTKFQVFYVVLTRLRLNFSFKCLAYKFSVAISTISVAFNATEISNRSFRNSKFLSEKL